MVLKSYYKLIIFTFFYLNHCGLAERHEHQLQVTNSGPSLLGVPLTFSAHISPACREPCTFQFDSRHSPPQTARGTQSAQVNFTFTQPFRKGHHTMHVRAFSREGRSLAYNTSHFEIVDMIPGSLVYSQPDAPVETKPYYVQTKKPVDLAVDLHDPTGYFENRSLSYAWAVDFRSLGLGQPTLNLTFPSPGRHSIAATVLYFQPPATLTYGAYQLSLTAMDPIESITVDGKTNIPHSQTLQLTVNCQGGGNVFQYCWQIRNSSNATHEPFDCQDATSTTSCFFQVQYYFGHPGEYLVQLYIQNFVDIQYRNISIKIFDVTNQVGLYEVILPVLAIVVAVVMIAGSVLLYQSHRPRLNVEVAEFDFETSSDNFQDSTFFEQLWSSVKARLTTAVGVVCCCRCCRSSSSTSVLIDDETSSTESHVT